MNRDTLEQDPCNTCGYEEGSIYCKEHCPHEAKVEQELTEFEEIDFMQEHKKIPVTLDLASCEDAISRKIISAFLSGLISDETERKKALQYINELPSVNPQPCEDVISRQAVIDGINRYFHDEYYQRTSIQDCRDCLIEDVIKPLPPVTPQQSCEGIAKAFQLGMALGFAKKHDEMDKVMEEVKKAVTPQPNTEQFAKWVAIEIFDENWEYNKDAFAEIACRKLAKLGKVRAKGDEWELVEPQERSVE